MATSIDALDIQISAKVTSANNAINRLTKNLDKLSTSLNRIDGSKITGLANGVSRLGSAMQTMNNVRTADFTRLANNIQRLASLNTAGLNSAASSMSHLARGLSQFSSVSSNAQQIAILTQSLSRLGGVGVQRAITNLHQLAVAMNGVMATLSRSPMVSNNVIQMTQALASLASQGGRVGTSSRSLVNSLNRTDRAMRTSTKSAWSLARAFGKFYANYFLIIRGAKALWGSIESTADYIESFNYYTVAFGKIASQWDENWDNYGSEGGRNYANSFVASMNDTISKLSGVQIQLSDDYTTGILTDTGLKNLGLNIQEVTQYASQLASVSDAVGMTGEATLAMAKGATMLAGDVSSLFNVDFSNVATNIQAVLQGQSRAGYKYGWDTTLATLQKYADEFDLSKPVSEMTQLEKRYLRYIVVLKQSAVAHGDLANTINSPSNMIRQLTTNLKETGMVLGQLFIPMLENVLPVVNGATIAIKRLLTEIAGFFGVEIDFEKFGQGYNQLEDETGDLSDSYDDLASSIEEVKSQLLGFDEVNKLSDTSATLSVGTEDNTIDLTDKIVSATEEYQKVWDEAFANMENTSQKWANTIGNAFGTLADYLEPITSFNSKNLNNFYNSFLEPLGSWTLGTGLPQLAEIFDDFMEDVDWDDLADDLNKFYKGVEPFEEGFGQGLLNFFDEATDIGADVIEAIGDAFGIFGDALDTIGADNVRLFGEGLGEIVPLLVTMAGLSKLPTIITNLGSGFGTFFGAIAKHPFMAIIAAVPLLNTALKNLKDDVLSGTEGGKLKEAAEDLAGGIDTLFTTLDSKIIDIDSQYAYYSEMATKYAEMSKNYNSLTTEEKNLVKQYADELATYAPDIMDNIDNVTGAWTDTTSELQKAIDKQAEFYKKQAIESVKAQTYEAIVEGKVGLADARDRVIELEKEMLKEMKESSAGKAILSEMGDIALGTDEVSQAYERFLIQTNRVSTLSYDEWVASKKAVKEYNDAINKAIAKINQLDNALVDLTPISTDVEASGNINLGGVGIGAIFSDDTSEAFEDYFDNLDKAKNESHLTVDTSGVREGCDNATNKVKFFNTEANRNSTVTLRVNKVDFIESLNGASALYSGTVSRMNSSLIIPSLSTSTYNTQVSAVVSEYLKKRKEVEDKKITPTVATANTRASFLNIKNDFTNTLGILQSSVEFQADKEALKKLTSDFQDAVSSMGGTLPGAISGLDFSNKLGIKKFATGGFVDEGQLFIAREAGPELVGSMGGHTAVANNQQITDGIAQAVYSAFTSALSTTNRGSSGDIIINIDGKQVFKAVQKQATNYVAQTGQTPFPV